MKQMSSSSASLTLAMVPVLILYIIFSKQLIRGLTVGAVRQGAGQI
jgi:raffinose/stachyose/melibiose transport system permease protein